MIHYITNVMYACVALQQGHFNNSVLHAFRWLVQVLAFILNMFRTKLVSTCGMATFKEICDCLLEMVVRFLENLRCVYVWYVSRMSL